MAHNRGPISDLWGYSVPLRPEGLGDLERFQARHLKVALGLAPQTHHSALLAALGVPNIQETLRSMVLRGFFNAFKSEHRLSRVLTRGLAVLAVDPAQLDGSFLGLVYAICNYNLGTVLTVASGFIDSEMIRPRSQPDGLIDSLRFLAASTDSTARLLMRLLVMP